MRFLAPVLAFLACPANAQTPALTQAEADTLPRLIDSLCVDIHPLNDCEQVILLIAAEDDSSADLIVLSDRRQPDDGAAPLLVLRNAVFNGSMWGMSPSLEPGEARTVLLHSEQSGIGRHPWFQTLRIGWQEDAFRVQGFGYSSYDRYTSGGYTCSLDHDSGDWMAEATWVDPETGEEDSITQSGRLDGPAPLLVDQSAFAPLPAPCQTVQTLFFDNLP